MSSVHSLGEISRAISNEAVRLIADYTGRGPTKARTTINGDWVFITLQDTLTKGEQKLVASGETEAVLTTRRRYQHVMRDDLQRVVSERLGRKVIAFLSDNHVNPDVAVEVFMLEPSVNGCADMPLPDDAATTDAAPTGSAAAPRARQPVPR